MKEQIKDMIHKFFRQYGAERAESISIDAIAEKCCAELEAHPDLKNYLMGNAEHSVLARYVPASYCLRHFVMQMILETWSEGKALANGNPTKITRIIDGKEFEIELTAAEIEKVFRHKDMEYLKEDARRHLAEFLDGDEYDESGEDDELLKDAKKEFKKRFGVSFDSVYNDEDALEEMAERFGDEHDCNVPDNQTWEFVIKEYLES